MDEYLTEDQFGDNSWDGEEELIPTDPMDQLTKREQDIFFRMIDLVPDGKSEQAIIYFMDHPAKIRAVVDNIKEKKELIANKDQAAIQAMFDAEGIDISQAQEFEIF